MPNIYKSFLNWEIDYLLCLPINNTFEIGGTEVGNFSFLNVNIECVGSACQSQNNSLAFMVYTLNTFVNPTNSTHPFTSYTTRYETTLLSNTRIRNFLYLHKNTLITDNSLLPLSK